MKRKYRKNGPVGPTHWSESQSQRVLENLFFAEMGLLGYVIRGVIREGGKVKVSWNLEVFCQRSCLRFSVFSTINLTVQEELANVNMAKYRKLHQEMEGAVERADMAENTLGQLRARNRSASVAPESTTTFGLTVSWGL